MNTSSPILKQILLLIQEGAIIALPMLLTILIIRFFINLFSHWLSPLIFFLPNILKEIPYIEILFGLFITLSIGIFFQHNLLKKALVIFEKKIISFIPFASKLYAGIKQVLTLIGKKNTKAQKDQIAWVRLPYRDIHCLGFMTGILPKEISPNKDENFYCFFIPHTPNPITGYFITASEKDCVFTSLTKEEAMSLIISGGIIKPERKNENAT